jgi:hypothetical protein
MPNPANIPLPQAASGPASKLTAPAPGQFVNNQELKNQAAFSIELTDGGGFAINAISMGSTPTAPGSAVWAMSDGSGVLGVGVGASAVGVQGAGPGIGVRGFSTGNDAVAGDTSSDAHAGVTGRNLTNGANGGVGIYGVGGKYAGKFDGDVLNGTLNVGVDIVLAASAPPLSLKSLEERVATLEAEVAALKTHVHFVYGKGLPGTTLMTLNNLQAPGSADYYLVECRDPKEFAAWQASNGNVWGGLSGGPPAQPGDHGPYPPWPETGSP